MRLVDYQKVLLFGELFADHVPTRAPRLLFLCRQKHRDRIDTKISRMAFFRVWFKFGSSAQNGARRKMLAGDTWILRAGRYYGIDTRLLRYERLLRLQVSVDDGRLLEAANFCRFLMARANC